MEEMEFSIDTDIIGALTVAFIIGKIIGLLKWSWIWVFSPIWIAAAIFLLIIGIHKLYWYIRNAWNR